jgi:hypothetical protein
MKERERERICVCTCVFFIQNRQTTEALSFGHWQFRKINGNLEIGTQTDI